MSDTLREEVERAMREAFVLEWRARFVPLYPPDKPLGEMTPYEQGLFRNAMPVGINAAVDATMALVRRERERRDREWSNRIESQDTLHPDSPDVDMAIAWYMRQRGAPHAPPRTEDRT